MSLTRFSCNARPLGSVGPQAAAVQALGRNGVIGATDWFDEYTSLRAPEDLSSRSSSFLRAVRDLEKAGVVCQARRDELRFERLLY